MIRLLIREASSLRQLIIFTRLLDTQATSTRCAPGSAARARAAALALRSAGTATFATASATRSAASVTRIVS